MTLVTDRMVEAALSAYHRKLPRGSSAEANTARDRMHSALAAALSTEPGVAEGMVLVPREPTDKMIDEGESFLLDTAAPRYISGSIYRAMLAAAPLPENIRALLDELDRLREALKPFAAAANCHSNDKEFMPDAMLIWQGGECTIRLGDLRRAAALSSSKQKDGGE